VFEPGDAQLPPELAPHAQASGIQYFDKASPDASLILLLSGSETANYSSLDYSFTITLP